MERSFTIVLLSEWVEDDVDHSKLVVSRVDDIIHSALLLARVRLVFGSGFHNLAKHVLIRVSRITESEQIPGQCDSVFQSV